MFAAGAASKPRTNAGCKTSEGWTHERIHQQFDHETSILRWVVLVLHLAPLAQNKAQRHSQHPKLSTFLHNGCLLKLVNARF